jgi:thiamine-phosphate diphosphorylase
MRVYFVTDPDLFMPATVEETCREMLEAGVRTVQLRDKTASGDVLIPAARMLRALCHDYGALFIVNDDLETALSSGADGVHVGQGDSCARSVREALGPDAVVGVSVRTPREAVRAEMDGADYVAANGVFSTPTKTDLDGPLGLDGLRLIRAATALPLVAIGGISSENAEAVLAAGADCLAGVRIRWDCPLLERYAPRTDPGEAPPGR